MRVSELSPARRALVDLMRRVQFGRIEGLRVSDGQPMLTPPPRVFRELKFPLDESQNRAPVSADFELKQQVLDLIELFDQLREGTLQWLEIKAGLPFRAQVEQPIGGVADE